MTPDMTSILSQIKSLEVQLSALRASLANLVNGEPTATHTFADLYGRFREQGDISTEEISAILYQLPLDQEEPR